MEQIINFKRMKKYKLFNSIGIASIVILFAMCNLRTDRDSEKIIGIWGLNKEGNASFDIRQDSIFYPDYFESFSYKINGDSIFIDHKHYKSKYQFFFRNDSLILKGKKEAAFIRFE
jgi:hypothetical protein